MSVGYMLRYLQCVQKMKQIVDENKLTVMATAARFVSRTLTLSDAELRPHSPALTRASKRRPGGTKASTWARSSSKVPISAIYRGTLAETSMLIPWRGSTHNDQLGTQLMVHRARSVEYYEKPGKLSKIAFDESKIPEELRIPRVTSSIW